MAIFYQVHVTCYLLKNSLAVKKGVALFKIEKNVKSKGWPRNGCDGIGIAKNLITIQVNLVLIPREAEMRHQPIPSQPFVTGSA